MKTQIELARDGIISEQMQVEISAADIRLMQ